MERVILNAPGLQLGRDSKLPVASAMFLVPDWLHHPLAWAQHIPFAFWIVEAHRPSVIVELGTHWGNSYFAFCQAVSTLSLPTSCYAIDTWRGDVHAGHYGEDVYESIERHNRTRYDAFSRLVRSTFDDARAHFADQSIDLLHIDGLHTYDACQHDFENWLPKLSRHGVVLFHDTNVRERDFGVHRLWSELKERYPHFEFPHGNGLGVLGVGRDVDGPLMELFAASQNARVASSTRHIFWRVGAALTAQMSLDAIQDEVGRSREELNHKAEIAEQHHIRCERLEADREQQRATLGEAHQTIGRLRAEREALKEDLKQQRATLGEAQQTIDALKLVALVANESLAEEKVQRALGKEREEKAGRGVADAEARCVKLRAELERTKSEGAMALAMRAADVERVCAELREFRTSHSWRITLPLRWASQGLRHIYARAAHLRRSRLSVLHHSLFGQLYSIFVRVALFRRVRSTPLARSFHAKARARHITEQRYASWLRVNEPTIEAIEALRESVASRLSDLPKISVIMPVYNTQPELLNRAIGSVHAQLYENWELCIADDGSSDPNTLKLLHRWTKRDSRIKLLRRRQNGGISLATNDAASLATGEFIAFLDHDDELTPDALAEIALSCRQSADVDVVYSDDDKIDTAGVRFAPQFKPDWSPTLLLSYMYMSHLFVVRRALFEELGGFRVGFEGSQDYDFALRASERVRRVEHVPKVLYHWRVVQGSTASSGDAKSESFARGCRAVSEAFERRGFTASVRQPQWAWDAKVGIFAPEFSHDGPKVSIIIPTRNGRELLENCLQSLKQTLYRNYEIVVIDNDSDDPATQSYLADLPHKVLRIGNPPGQGFNFAHINNAAAQSVDAEYLLFLNNDTVVRNPEWLSQMVGYAGMPGIGAVGARLHFPDDTIQHAGVVHGHYQGLAGPAFRNAPSSDAGYLAYAYVSREYSAVTAACMLTRRSLFLEVGGFDAECFGVAYNDVDYCYRLVDLGYRCIYCATANLYHAEGKSRGFADNPREIAAFRAKHGDRRDPWYNSNLSLDDEHFKFQPHHAPAHCDEPVRAIMVTHNLNCEGAPNSQLELVRGLARSGVVTPLVISPADGPLRALYEAAGIEVQIIRNPLMDSPSLDEYEQRLSEIGSFYRRHGGELVYANTLQTFWAIDAAEEAMLPTIWNPRESEPWETYFDCLAPPIRERAYKAFDHPYRVIFVSAATRQVWAPVEKTFNFTVIHNGLDRSRFDAQLAAVPRNKARDALGLAPDELAVVLVGTVCERKGQVDLIKAVAQMDPALLERLKFFIVGDRPGPYSDALKHEWRALSLAAQRRVEVVPENGQIAKYFSAADISVCTSRIESYPRVVLEAMAAELPVVTTPVFGTREQVKEGVNALLYEPGNVAALAEHLTRLAEDPELRTTLANNSALVLASLTTYPEMIRRYGRIFREARFSKGTPWQPLRQG